MSSFRSYPSWYYYSCDADCDSNYADDVIARRPIFTLNDLKNIERHLFKQGRNYKSGYSTNLILDLNSTLKLIRVSVYRLFMLQTQKKVFYA